MARKQYLQTDVFEGYSLIGIVCGQPDFRASYFINQTVQLKLKKYHDFHFPDENSPAFSWYAFHHDRFRRDYFFIRNKTGANLLLPELYRFDYILLIYGNLPDDDLKSTLGLLRKTPYVTAAFIQDENNLKNGGLLIEQNERHATRYFLQ